MSDQSFSWAQMGLLNVSVSGRENRFEKLMDPWDLLPKDMLENGQKNWQTLLQLLAPESQFSVNKTVYESDITSFLDGYVLKRWKVTSSVCMAAAEDESDSFNAVVFFHHLLPPSCLSSSHLFLFSIFFSSLPQTQSSVHLPQMDTWTCRRFPLAWFQEKDWHLLSVPGRTVSFPLAGPTWSRRLQ